MKTSEQGLQLIIEREGKRNTAYRDSENIWTIGIGHTGPEVHEGLVWTDAQVLEAFRANIEEAEAAVNASVTRPLEQHQFDALVSFTINVGVGAVAHSTMVREINAGDMADIPAQFDRWHIPPAITSRRNAEREQWKGTQFVARIP